MAYYILLHVIFPTFFENKKLLFLIAYVVVMTFFISIDYIHLKKILPFFGGHTPRGDLPLFSFINRSLLLFSYIAFTTAGWYLNSRSILKIKEQSEKEKGIISRELGFLKNQFNSHLTFNFLNFCYGKMLDSSPKAAEAMEDFSEMLRYSMSNKLAEYVPLEREVQYIEHFIRIQKCLTTKIFVEFEYRGNIDNCYILPMLLAIFVENSFKHGISSDADNPITILLLVEEDEIKFKIKNNRTNRKIFISTGIGLQNARKILNLFYDKKHSLKIEQTDNTYSCELNLKAYNRT